MRTTFDFYLRFYYCLSLKAMYYSNGLSFQELWLEQTFATMPIDIVLLESFIAATIVVAIGTMSTVARKFLDKFYEISVLNVLFA